MPSVELGFLEICEPWKVESRLFPSKVGGKPAWLSLKPLPTADDLKCEICHKVMVFLCQVYAPYEGQLIDKVILDNNFHRTIFLFVCRDADCNKRGSCQNIKAFRNSLRRDNEFYSNVPPEEKPDPNFELKKWTDLCNLCGIASGQKCSRCKVVFYCCKEHQVIDWKGGHKLSCCSDMKTEVVSNNAKILFSEWELITETEDIENDKVTEQDELEEYEKLKAEGKTGVLADISESDLDAHVTSEMDKVFSKFKKRIEDYPDQVIRYSRGGLPLLISKEEIPSVPNCELCGSPRQFEFQVMPQMLSMLKENELDWGVLLIYTCKNSCLGDSINSYKKEFVWKQDVSINDST